MPRRSGPQRAAIYCRVSTQQQSAAGDNGGNGLSLEEQEDECRTFCRLRKWEVAQVYSEIESGRSLLNRPKAQDLLATLRSRDRPGVVVIYDLSRLTRNLKDLLHLVEELKRRRVELVSVKEHQLLDTTSPTGELMIRFLGLILSWQREQVAARTSGALRWRRGQLLPYGQVPVGFRRQGNRLVPVPEKMEAVKRAYELRLRDRLPYRAIAERLNAERHTTKEGKQFRTEVVRRIIGNPIYHQFLPEDLQKVLREVGYPPDRGSASDG